MIIIIKFSYGFWISIHYLANDSPLVVNGRLCFISITPSLPSPAFSATRLPQNTGSPILGAKFCSSNAIKKFHPLNEFTSKAWASKAVKKFKPRVQFNAVNHSGNPPLKITNEFKKASSQINSIKHPLNIIHKQSLGQLKLSIKYLHNIIQLSISQYNSIKYLYNIIQTSIQSI